MIKIFLRLFIRNFLKKGLLNSLNVFGFSLGMIATLFIVIYTDHAFSYDTFHPNAKNIYRLEALLDGDLWFSNLGMEHGEALAAGSFPEIATTVLLKGHRRVYISQGEQRFVEDKIYQAPVGSKFFELFDFRTLQGDENDFLTAPHTVVITESAATKYFGDKDPLGEVLQYDSMSLKITGVVEDVPTNSHLEFNFIYTNPGTFARDHFHTHTYVELVEGTDVKTLEAKIKALDVSYDASHEFREARLVALPDIYFESRATFGSGGQGDSVQLSIFIIVGALILLITVSNYVHLSLAIYSNKSVEIGIRKVLGESRKQLMRAFLGESVFMMTMSIPLILIGLHFLLPFFSDFVGIRLENKLWTSPEYWVSALALLLALSAVTIIYPASLLSRSNVGALIKNKSNLTQGASLRFKNALISIQFVLLFTLGISAWFMNRQVHFLDTKDMGFNAESMVRISNGWAIGGIENYRLFKNELLRNSQVVGITCGPMMGDVLEPTPFRIEGSDQVYENLLNYEVDVDYFDVHQMGIDQGDLSQLMEAVRDGQTVSLVNQRLVEQFGWFDDAIGKHITLYPGTENEQVIRVDAVFENFHFFSLKEQMTPQVISMKTDLPFVNRNIFVKVAGGNSPSIVKQIDEAWQAQAPELPMQYEFMDDVVERFYAKEKQTGQVSVVFSMLAVMLSILGLVGFMIYIISLKSKEMAIRKVLGASLFQIITLLNRQLFLIILLAALLGSTLSYWFISQWLFDYAYSIEIRPITFVVSTVIVYLIVFFITGIQSIKSAAMRPELTLRND